MAFLSLFEKLFAERTAQKQISFGCSFVSLSPTGARVGIFVSDKEEADCTLEPGSLAKQGRIHLS